MSGDIAHRGYSDVLWVDEGTLFSGKLPVLNEVSRNSVLLHGVQYSRDIARKLCLSYGIDSAVACVSVSKSDEEELSRHLRTDKLVDCSTIIAVGGGRVQDIAKMIAKALDKMLIIIPTLVATDGLASPVAVLRDTQGGSTSHGAKAPNCLLMCWQIIEKAPEIYWRALIGDVVGNLVAVREFRYFDYNHLSPEEKLAADDGCSMAESAALSIFQFQAPRLEDAMFRMRLVEAAIQSSFAMISAGTSRPCSGSEHLLSHAIDSLALSPGWLHGIQVGASVPICLDLLNERDIKSEVEQLYMSVGMPISLLELGIPIGERIFDIVKAAPATRPGRKSILDKFSAEEIVRRIVG